MTQKLDLLSVQKVAQAILFIRGQRVMLDADLAQLYGVSTKALNQAVKRNRNRFPQDFMFKLTPTEKAEVVTNCDHLKRLKYSSSLPNAFTEHDAVMLASLLNSPIAVAASIHVVRAFVRLRQWLVSHADLARKLQQLEEKYDKQFAVVFEAIRALMEPPPEPKKSRIGFNSEGRE